MRKADPFIVRFFMGLTKPKKTNILGNEHAGVIDYTQENFTKNDDTYDIIFDTVGKSTFSGSLQSLKKTGA